VGVIFASPDIIPSLGMFCVWRMILGMHLSDENIAEFTTLWEEEFKETLAPADARARATSFLELYATLARPLPGEDPEEAIIS